MESNIEKITIAVPVQIPTTDNIGKAIIRAFERVRHNLPDGSLSPMVSDCERWVAEFGKGMDAQDVANAFWRGSIGDLGPFTHISSTTLIGWLKAWKNHPDRFAQKRQIDVSHQLAESGTITPEEQSKIDKDWILGCCDKFNTLGWYSDMGHVLFLALRREKLIVTGKARYDELAELVKLDDIEAAKLANARAEIGKTQLQKLIEAISGGAIDLIKNKVRHKAVQLWLVENSKKYINHAAVT